MVSRPTRQSPLRRGANANEPALAFFVGGLLVPALVFAMLLFGVASGGGLGWDLRVPRVLHEFDTPSLDVVMLSLTWVGSEYGIVAITLVTLGVLVQRGRRRDAYFFALALAGAMALDVALKHIVQRPRPSLWHPLAPASGFSFPSGHAMSSAAVLAALAIILWPGRWRLPLLAAGAPFVIGIGISRVYVGVHYPSDVVGGWALSLAWVAALDIFVRRSSRGFA